MPAIRLKKYVADIYRATDSPTELCWRIKVVAEGIDDAPSEIFVFRVMAESDPDTPDIFEGVTRMVDLSLMPPRKPVFTPDTDYTEYQQCYRSSEVIFDLWTMEDLQKAWEMLQARTKTLVDDLNRNAVLFNYNSVTLETNNPPVEVIVSKPPASLNISYEPAGQVDIDDGRQVITVPNNTLKGWLPVTGSQPIDFVDLPPVNAAFYYNIAEDPALMDLWARLDKTTFTSHGVYYNGIKLPYGVVYTMTRDTIYWLRYDPNTVPGFNSANNPADTIGNAPWPEDYIDALHPGSVRPIINLNLYLV